MSTATKAKKMKILLPGDASPYSEEAVQAVTERPWPAGTTVRVLSAVESVGVPAMGPLMFDAAGSLEQLQQQRTKQASQLTKKEPNSLPPSALPTETVAHAGH